MRGDGRAGTSPQALFIQHFEGVFSLVFYSVHQGGAVHRHIPHCVYWSRDSHTRYTISHPISGTRSGGLGEKSDKNLPAGGVLQK